jgi:hypothetical protein
LPVLSGVSDESGPVDSLPPSPAVAAALAHLLLLPPPPQSPTKKIFTHAPNDATITSAAKSKDNPSPPLIKADANQPQPHEKFRPESVAHAQPQPQWPASPRLKRFNVGEFISMESSRRWVGAGGGARNNESASVAVADALRVEELPTTPSFSSPSDSATATFTAAATAEYTAAAAADSNSSPPPSSSHQKSAFLTVLTAPPIFTHDFSALPLPAFPSPRSTWSLPPASARFFRRADEVLCVGGVGVERLIDPPRTGGGGGGKKPKLLAPPGWGQGQGQFNVVSKYKY